MERKNKIQELKSFTLNRRYGAWSYRTLCARLFLWAEDPKRIPFPLHPALSAPFACSPSSSSSEATLIQGEGTQPSTGTHKPMFYHGARWGSEMTWGKRKEHARAVLLASPLTSTLIHRFQGRHTNTSFSCSAQPTLWPTVHSFTLLLVDITVQRNTASN